MPSPVAHVSVGYLLYRFFAGRISFRFAAAGCILSFVLTAFFLFMSMVPDLDSVVGLLTDQMGRYHNNWTHSIVACIGISLIGAAALNIIVRGFLLCFAAAFSCCALHIFMDFMSYGRGVMLLWPFTDQRFKPPFYIFTGLHWSDGIWSSRHFLTLLNELVFVAILVACVKIMNQSGAEKELNGAE